MIGQQFRVSPNPRDFLIRFVERDERALLLSVTGQVIDVLSLVFGQQLRERPRVGFDLNGFHNGDSLRSMRN